MAQTSNALARNTEARTIRVDVSGIVGEKPAIFRSDNKKVRFGYATLPFGPFLVGRSVLNLGQTPCRNHQSLQKLDQLDLRRGQPLSTWALRHDGAAQGFRSWAGAML